MRAILGLLVTVMFFSARPDACANTQLQVEIPNWIAAPPGQSITIPFVVNNTGTVPFTFVPRSLLGPGQLGNFQVDDRGSSTSIATYTFYGPGSIANAQQDTNWFEWNQGFINELQAVTIMPGEVMSFPLWSFEIQSYLSQGELQNNWLNGENYNSRTDLNVNLPVDIFIFSFSYNPFGLCGPFIDVCNPSFYIYATIFQADSLAFGPLYDGVPTPMFSPLFGPAPSPGGIPEPAALIPLGVGLTGLALARRRNRRLCQP